MVKVIQACSSGEISEDALGYEEMRYLYSILSVVTSDTQRLEENKRLEVVNWALNQQIADIQKCPTDNKDKLCRIIANIKTIMQSFKEGIPDGFKDSYKQLVQHLIQILHANLDHEDLTNQLLNFFHNSVRVLGIESIPLIVDVSTLCVTNLEYNRLFDVFQIINHCIDEFKTTSLKILEPCYGILLTKACQTPMPQSEISDEDK